MNSYQNLPKKWKNQFVYGSHGNNMSNRLRVSTLRSLIQTCDFYSWLLRFIFSRKNSILLKIHKGYSLYIVGIHHGHQEGAVAQQLHKIQIIIECITIKSTHVSRHLSLSVNVSFSNHLPRKASNYQVNIITKRHKSKCRKCSVKFKLSDAMSRVSNVPIQ